MAAVLLFCCTGISAAAESGAGRQTVRVGFFPFDGYHMVDEDGNRSGYGYDILQKMLIYENWNYAYVGYEENANWQDMLAMLENGEIQMVTSATMTEDRLDKFSYSSVPIGTSSTRLTVKAGNGDYTISDYTDWNGIRVGLLANNSRNDSFAAYAETHGFTYTPVILQSQDELDAALQAGEVDMIVTSNLLKLSNVTTVDQFDEKPFYVIVKKGDEALLAQANDALTQLQENEPSFAQDLYSKYYRSNAGEHVTFTRDEQQYIKDCNGCGRVFYAIVNPDRRPLSYCEDGEMKGLLVDICTEAFARSGLDIRFVSTDTRDNYLQQMLGDDNTIVCDFTDDYSRAESIGYVLTDAYYSSSFSRLSLKSYTGATKRRAVIGRSITQPILPQDCDEVALAYPSTEACKNAILAGEADYATLYTRNAQEYVFRDETNSLQCTALSNLSVSFAVAVDNDESAYLSGILQKCLRSLSSDELNRLSEVYTYYERGPQSLVGLIYQQPILLISAVVVLFIFLIGVILLVGAKRKQQRERITNQKLGAALIEAKKANEAKTTFLSRVSHDMRTPLNGILGLTALMKEQVTEPQVMSDLSELELSGHYLLNLINDTLDMSRIESGKLELRPAVCEGRTLFGSILRLGSINAQKKQVALHAEAAELPDEMLYIDVARVEQIFLNILGNAIKFTPAGGKVTLTIKNLARSEHAITDEFVIEDTGIGMSAEFLPHIFESFAQEDTTRTSSYQGTGLGMSITKHLLNAMGGSISVESEPGKGSRFTIILPLPIAAEDKVTEWRAQNVRVETRGSLLGRRILLCEDHPLNTKIATRLLEAKGASVEHAENGRIGVDLFECSAPGYYDAVLMDIRMPVMDGLDAARAIRRLARPDAATVPIIAMTANAFAEDIAQTRAAGMDAHLSKPIETDVLYSTLEKLLQTKNAVL